MDECREDRILTWGAVVVELVDLHQGLGRGGESFWELDLNHLERARAAQLS